MKKLLEIYAAFFRMGIVTFGGGYAMLPILQREAVERKQWVTNEEVMDYYAVSQGMPGIIAVNVSVFIGYRQKKIAGGVAAALGVVSPCLLIITVIAAFLSNFQDNLYVKYAFAGVSICVAALILNSVIGLWKKGVTDWFGIALCAALFLGMELTSVSPILMVICAAVLGVAAKGLKGELRKKEGDQ